VKLNDKIIQSAADALLDANKIWLTTHVKSDGDGIGSELALVRALRALGKDARVINDTVVPKALRFLQVDGDEIMLFDPNDHEAFLRSADTVVVLDVGLTYRLGRMESRFLESPAVKICLDHHCDCDKAFHHILSDPDVGSTGEILFRLLRVMKVEIGPEVASPLFAAISIDSGSFSYERCTPQTFHTAGELVTSGAEPYALHLNLNWQRRLSEVKLEGDVIQNLRLDGSGVIAYSEVSRDMLKRYTIDPMEMPAVVNIPLSLKGVELALLFVELDPCTINVSARSKGRIPVNALARQFGGGGHPLAAGFCIKGPLEQVKAKVLAEARGFMGKPSSLCDSA